MNKNILSNFSIKQPNALSTLLVLGGLTIGAGLLSSYKVHRNKPVPKTAAPALITLKAQKMADSLEALTDLAFPGNGETWILQQNGKILSLKNGKVSPEPILDLKSKMVEVHNGYEERGLLGIALHPQFKTNRKFYVFYSRPRPTPKPGVRIDHTDVVAEYTLPASGPVDANSGRVIITFDKPDGNHDGGCVKFGPDGYLYISLGDGGGQHDKHGEIGNGQNMNTLLGKILRIDINSDSTYTVPKDNPFVGKPDVKPEIWAYGFRNPYRFSFDKATKQLFAGEVGQDLWEEVDIVTKGANYGWRVVEGTHCHNFTNTPETGCKIDGITMPIHEYPHKEGVSIMGGFVYNGKALPALKSKYFFTDWTGPVWYLQKSGANWVRGDIKLNNIAPGQKITGISEDESGELYVMTNPDTGPGNTKCAVYKVVRN